MDTSYRQNLSVWQSLPGLHFTAILGRRFNVLVACSCFYLDKKFKLDETFLPVKRLICKRPFSLYSCVQANKP